MMFKNFMKLLLYSSTLSAEGKQKILGEKKKILIDDELGNCNKRVLSVLCLKFSEIKVLVLVS